jgi:hypothetical protein
MIQGLNEIFTASTDEYYDPEVFFFIIEGQVPYVSFMEMRFFSGHGLKLTTSTISHLVRCFLQENLEIPLAPVMVFSFLSSGAVSTCLAYVMNMKPSLPSAADRS